ncbi:MAG: tRNA pseudouridine(38-40) synthase TruA [Desulfobacterales bacterium]|nr:tRNA pseudouridine(38-40) synthase TruA [Desulfobacterales bacterium]
MAQEKLYHYLIHIQYLGFRYHGWQKQPGVKTIEAMIEKTLGFILEESGFRILGASRTDSKVSANQSAFMLFVRDALDMEALQSKLNINLPNDIRVTGVEEKSRTFNIIRSSKVKEYLYLFAFGCKSHPFCAAMMHTVQEDLDIELMKQGARLFEGQHHFGSYCTKPGPKTCLERDIRVCRIEENTEFRASFFPEKSWLLRIQASGFLRYQVRLIMGQLFKLGKRDIDLNRIQQSLSGSQVLPLKEIAPGSGLILNKIVFQAD